MYRTDPFLKGSADSRWENKTKSGSEMKPIKKASGKLKKLSNLRNEFKDVLKVLPRIIYHLESFDAPLIRSAIPNTTNALSSF